MQLLNRFTVFTKRILAHKLYIIMLASIVLLTVIYKFLPEKSQSTDIKVAVFSEDPSDYTDLTIAEIVRSNSIYTFYLAKDEETLLRDVKSGFAECGFVIPNGFFTDYIKGHVDANPIQLYKTPSSSLSTAIAETWFANMYQIVAEDILLETVNLPEFNTDFIERYHYYTESDETFQMKNVTEDVFSFETMVYRITLPVYEITLLLLLFSGLLGLLLFEQDVEKRMYLSLGHYDLFQIKAMSVATAILPVLATGLVSTLTINGLTGQLLNLLLAGLLVFLFTIVLSLFIRKSTLLAKVLPLILLISILGIFVKSVM